MSIRRQRQCVAHTRTRTHTLTLNAQHHVPQANTDTRTRRYTSPGVRTSVLVHHHVPQPALAPRQLTLRRRRRHERHHLRRRPGKILHRKRTALLLWWRRVVVCIAGRLRRGGGGEWRRHRERARLLRRRSGEGPGAGSGIGGRRLWQSCSVERRVRRVDVRRWLCLLWQTLRRRARCVGMRLVRRVIQHLLSAASGVLLRVCGLLGWQPASRLGKR